MRLPQFNRIFRPLTVTGSLAFIATARAARAKLPRALDAEIVLDKANLRTVLATGDLQQRASVRSHDGETLSLGQHHGTRSIAFDGWRYFPWYWLGKNRSRQ